ECGLAGAVVLTLVHEGLKRTTKLAPRMDLLGMNALAKLLNKGRFPVPGNGRLFWLTMAGDILSNTLYYSLSGAGSPRGRSLRGSMLGLAAGIGAVILPKHLGLPNAPSNRTTTTKVFTIGLYLLGAVVTVAVLKSLDKKRG
ncbi:MAG: hypothetical protein WKF70_01120, partial [Chitinophagaceae bacterium]